MPAHQQTLRLFFTCDGRDVGMRSWIAAPRVGDEVCLSSKLYRVHGLCWGVSEDDDMQQGPTINIQLVYVRDRS